MEQNENQVKSRKEKIINGILTALIALGLVGIGFFVGFLVDMKKNDDASSRIDWVISEIKKEYYVDIPDAALVDAATEGLEHILEFSQYYNEEELTDVEYAATGHKIGIGINYAYNPAKELIVYRVLGNSPAEKAGFLKYDVILGVRLSGSTENFTPITDYDSLVSSLDALPENTDLEFRMKSSGREVFRTVQKNDFVQQTTFYYNNETVKELPEDAAYIRFDTFTGQAVSQFAAAMERFKTEGKTQLILDLRGNGGGNVDIMQEIAAHLVKAEKGATPVVMVAEYKNRKEEYKAAASVFADYGFTSIKVLVDNDTASASEALLGAMLDYGSITTADLYGVRTYGKGIMQTTIVQRVLGYALKLTTAKIRWPISNTCIQKEGENAGGILPDHIVGETFSEEAYSFEKDAALQAAIASLR